jgi:quinoprotein glucose dehydrogenase
MPSTALRIVVVWTAGSAAIVGGACALGLLAQGASAPAATRTSAPAGSFWGYGGGPEQTRYSSLTEINRANVRNLEVAWTYDTGEPGAMQTQPMVVDGVVYGYTPTHKTFALDGATGAVKWTFDSGMRGGGPNRGFMYWAGGADRRIFSAVTNYVYALNVDTGQPIASFGTGGRIDLREGLGRPVETQGVRLTSPGVVYRDLMIVGGRVGEGLPTSPGYVRAYDVRTGSLRWTFHTIPHPGEAGHDTWPADAWQYTGAANSWPGMALDEARGIVYVPTGSAASDFYGADRLGDNLYANALVALDAATGRRLWHFQFVKHDIWDRDLPAPPTLVQVRRNGRTIDAVVQATKHGMVFVFDRTNGEPLFPIEYRRFPSSAVPGERAADTQPIVTTPKPFARQLLTEELLTSRTPQARQWALDQFRLFKSEGQFAPFEINKQTVVFPGFDGGAEWGGQAFDPETGFYYVNSNDLAWTGGLAPNLGGQSGRALYQQHCSTCHLDSREGTPPATPSLVGVGSRRTYAEMVAQIRQGVGRMAGFPTLSGTQINAIIGFMLAGEDEPAGAGRRGGGAGQPPPVDPRINNDYRFTGYRKFLDPDGYPAVAPPWGTLNALNVNTGEWAWQIPFGEYPELVARGMTNTGSENYGGPIVTAGGLLFIGATNHDRKFRAFDKATGALLWETTLPSSGNATPATYMAGARQFVVIAAGGGKSPQGGPGGVYVAFALPVPGR